MLSTIIFHATATALQVLVGGLLLRRGPRNEAMALLAHLFLCNACISLLGFLRAADLDPLGITDRMASKRAMLDAGTNLLILWLALAYPRRACWLPPRPVWTAPIMVFTIVVACDALVGGLSTVRGPGAETLVDAVFGYVVFDVAFAILLIRWTRLWILDPGAEREPFMLLLAVFGMRAMHLSILVPALEWRKYTDGSSAATIVVMAALGLFVVLAAFVTFMRVISHAPPDHRQDHLHAVVVVFLLVGVAEGVMNATIRNWGDLRWWEGFTLRYDSLVARTGMVWLAFPALFAGGRHPRLLTRIVLGGAAGIGAASITWAMAPQAIMAGVAAAAAAALIMIASMPRWWPHLAMWRNAHPGEAPPSEGPKESTA